MRILKIAFTILVFFLFLISIQAQILDYRTNIVINDHGRLQKTKYFKIQVNNAKQRDIGNIVVHHSGNSKFKIIDAKIYYNDSVVRKLNQKDVVTTNASSAYTLYQDDLVTSFNLHWDKYPYIIEYSYEENHNDFLYIEMWSPYIAMGWKTEHAILSINLPRSYMVNMDYDDYFHFEQIDNPDDTRSLHWECENYVVPKMETFAPSLSSVVPIVSVVPNEFEYGVKGSFSSWKDYAIWMENLNNDVDDLPQYEKDTLDKLLKGIDSKKQKIKTLYSYLQNNTNYVNVQIDLGGFKSYPASYVCKNRYGDCKALTTYMKSMLDYIGVKAHYTLIKSGINNYKINTDFPSQQFNHILLTVPLDSDTIFLENTSKYLPYNHLSASNQGRYALMIDGGNSKLIKTPAYSPEDNLEKKLYQIAINESGDGVIRFKGELKGRSFEELNYYNKASKSESLERKIDDIVSLKKFKLQSWDIEEGENSILLNVEGNVKDVAKNLGDLKLVSPPQLNLSKLESPEKRSLAFDFSLPYYIDHTFCYEMGKMSFQEIQFPKPIMIKSRFGEFSYRASEKNKEICVQRIFKIYQGSYSLQEYDEFYEFYKKVYKSQNKTSIIFK